jgi:hypothetical protein
MRLPLSRRGRDDKQWSGLIQQGCTMRRASPMARVAALAAVSAGGAPSYLEGVVPARCLQTPRGTPGEPCLAGVIVTHPNGRTTPYTPRPESGTSLATPLVAPFINGLRSGQRHATQRGSQ